MSEEKSIRLAKAAKELNVSTATIIEHLAKQGHQVENNPNSKLDGELHSILLRDFKGDIQLKEEAQNVSLSKLKKEEKVEITKEAPSKSKKEADQEEILIKNVSVPDAPIDLHLEKEEKPVKKSVEKVKIEKTVLEGTKVVGKVDLTKAKKSKKEEEKVETKVEEPKKEKGAIAEVPQVKEKEETKKAAPAKAIEEEPKKEVLAKVETPVEEVKVEVAKIEKPEEVVEKKEKKEAKEIVDAKEEKVSKEEVKIVASDKKPEEPKGPEAGDSEGEGKDRHTTKYETLSGPKILGNIVLPVNAPKKKQPVASSNQDKSDQNRKKRKRKGPERPAGAPGAPGAPGQSAGQGGQRPYQGRPDGAKRFERKPGGPPARPVIKAELTEKEVQDQIKATLARLSGAGKSGKFAQRSKLRRQKRDDVASAAEEAQLEKDLQSKILKVTEFVTANQLASMMEVPVNKVISTCMSLGMFVSINQRLDAESLSLVAEEFGFEVEFVKVDDQEIINEEADDPKDLIPRAPIVTVMGHVDHGKTSLLDYVRKANVIAGEAGGITQHIGAYEVSLENGRKISFLDTPGHEAFTAMRARGAKVTDVAIIVISADDSVMPQTVEAINHAQAANVPIVFAFNKIDKEGANPNKIREQLSAMNILVEDWGGKYQCQEISAKKGLNVDLLLEKVCLEADLLELTANPNKMAQGTVIEAMLDKGRGIITTVLVQAGTLKIGDPILAGCYSGRVKALYNERGQRIEEAGPSSPVQVLGMQGAPQAGDKFNAMESEVAARDIANKRLQLSREQGMRSQKHITLDEIGRRLAIGNFKELNVIVKGDVDGSVEALADSLLKLSTPEIQVNVVHKAVGQISESDVLLASASDAIIIGFQVRPSLNARKIAEAEEIDIRMYSIIYDAINEIKSAMEGMLAPTIEEKIVCNVEIREVFKITKVGTIAGCMVTDGKIHRNTKVRIIRDGVVVHTGELESLKRFKDDVKEVSAGFECGLNIKNFNDIEAGDTIEGYEQVEVKRKLGGK